MAQMTTAAENKTLPIRLAAAAVTAMGATSLSGILLSPFSPWWGTRYAWPLIHMDLWQRSLYQVGIGVWVVLISLLLTRPRQEAPPEPAPDPVGPDAGSKTAKLKKTAAKVGTAILLYLLPLVPMVATLILFRRPEAYGQGIGGLAELAADGASRGLVTVAHGGALLGVGLVALAISRGALQLGRFQTLLAILAGLVLLQLVLLAGLGLPAMGVCGSLSLLGLALSPWSREQSRWRAMGLIGAAVGLTGFAGANVVGAVKQEANRVRKLALLQCKPGSQKLGIGLAGVSDSFLMAGPEGQGPTLFVLATSPANPETVATAVQRAFPSCRASPDQAFNPQELPIRVLSARPLTVDLTVRYAPLEPKADLSQLKVKAETAIRSAFLPQPGSWPHIHDYGAGELARLPDLSSMGLKRVQATCSVPSQPNKACDPRSFDIGEPGQYPSLGRLTVEIAR